MRRTVTWRLSSPQCPDRTLIKSRQCTRRHAACRGLCWSATPGGPAAVFALVVVGVVVFEQLGVVIEVVVRRALASELALQRVEVGVGGVIFQLPRHLRLL